MYLRDPWHSEACWHIACTVLYYLPTRSMTWWGKLTESLYLRDPWHGEAGWQRACAYLPDPWQGELWWQRACTVLTVRDPSTMTWWGMLTLESWQRAWTYVIHDMVWHVDSVHLLTLSKTWCRMLAESMSSIKESLPVSPRTSCKFCSRHVFTRLIRMDLKKK
jgi:hypothetical protein